MMKGILLLPDSLSAYCLDWISQRLLLFDNRRSSALTLIICDSSDLLRQSVTIGLSNSLVMENWFINP